MKVRLVFHGAIRAALGGLREFTCHASTPAEAIRCVFTQFRPTEPAPGRKWVLSISGVNSRQALYSPIGSETLHVTPVLMGSGGNTGAFLQIAIAVVLLAVGWWNPLGWTMTANALIGAGIAMAAGGLIQLLMPQPKLNAPPTTQKRAATWEQDETRPTPAQGSLSASAATRSLDTTSTSTSRLNLHRSSASRRAPISAV